MGSAITFPVQSYLFAVISVAALLISRGIRPSYRSIRAASREVLVFGDDMIVPRDSHDMTVALLTHLQLRVNAAKTFSEGNFRESCGYDAFSGKDVTRISIMCAPSVSKPETVLSTVDVHNNLLLAGYDKTAAYVRRTVDSLRRFRFREVTPDSGAIGWKAYCPVIPPGTRYRWNTDLQRAEIQATVPRGTMARTPVDSDAMLLQYFTEVKGPPKESKDRLGRMALRGKLRLGLAWVAASI